MSDDPPLSALYREGRLRLSEFVLARADAVETPVPATPPWTVHDAVAHLTGVAEDLLAGAVPNTGPTPEWTAGHVARFRDLPLEDVVRRWAEVSPEVEEVLDRRPIWPIVLDVGAHELDVRAALGDTGARDTDLVTAGAVALLRGLRVPRPLVVRTEHTEVTVGPDASGEEPVVLRTTTFEAFRWRLGRRSRGQLAALDWSGDPEPYLDHLCVFGPAEVDVVE
ncbi:MAG: hypothetical protein ACXVX8_01035 [Blastococcus sp.]